MDYQYLALVKDAMVGSLGRLDEAIAQQDDFLTEAALRETRDRADAALKASIKIDTPEWRRRRASNAAKARWAKRSEEQRIAEMAAVRQGSK
ncbi:MAG TPA: hypothetical protein VFF10_09815 [Trueperaceae bacterium]|jgi:hypothetical protein|nr:hypothetical protein [Trueperaceae bacterium]